MRLDSLDRIEGLELDDKEIVAELERHHIKEEDATLIVLTSIFNLDALVTYNKKHLRNKSKVINKVFQKLFSHAPLHL